MSTSPPPAELNEADDKPHEAQAILESKQEQTEEANESKPTRSTSGTTADEDEKPKRRPRLSDLQATITTLTNERRDMLTDIDLYKRDIALLQSDLSRLQAQALPSFELREANARILEELRSHKAAANAVVAARDTEIERLTEVVSGLKLCISSSTRVDEAVGDDAVREAWGRIGYEVVNWCLANGAVKGGQLDVEALGEETKGVLERVVPGHDELIGDGRRVHVAAAVMAEVLAREVFSGWFLGLEKEQEGVLRGLEGRFNDTASPSSLTSWRSTTQALLRTHLLSTPLLAQLTSRITTALLSHITPLLLSPPSASREKALAAIVDSTIRIATLMRCQRARFRVKDTPVGSKWDAESMEDLTGEEEEGHVVGCVAWPGVEKVGDEMGEGREVRVVVKARVVCVEGVEAEDEEGREGNNVK